MPGSQAAWDALFDDDFYVDDPREPSPTAAEPLLRQAIAADPADVTSTLLLASVLARQLTTLYFFGECYGLPWAEEILDGEADPEADEDPEDYVERLWFEAVTVREDEIGRLLAPLADNGAVAAQLALAVEAAREWREAEAVEVPVAEELLRAHDGLVEPVDLFARDYDWYELDFAVMYNNNGDVAHHTWLAADADRLRRALDLVIDRDESDRIFHDAPGELLTLSHFVEGSLATTVDLRPHLRESDTHVHRMDWAAVTIPELTGTPLPIGHPVEASLSVVGGLHYGANPAPG